MNREIKFKAWESYIDKMHQWEVVKQWDFYWVESSTFIFLQFTGLQDKNKVDIYEGDIIRCGDKIMQVIFENGCFYTPYEKSKYRIGGWTKGTLEIIGNIYENPELINP